MSAWPRLALNAAACAMGDEALGTPSGTCTTWPVPVVTVRGLSPLPTLLASADMPMRSESFRF